MNNNSGISFEREVVSSGRKLGMHIFKIASYKFTKYAIRGLYDIILIYKGIPCGVECKAMAEPVSFNFNRVQDNQVAALLELEKNGGKGYILLNIRGRNPKMYYIPILEFLKLKEEYNKAGRNSIPVIDYPKLKAATRIPGKTILWNLEELFY